MIKDIIKLLLEHNIKKTIKELNMHRIKDSITITLKTDLHTRTNRNRYLSKISITTQRNKNLN